MLPLRSDQLLDFNWIKMRHSLSNQVKLLVFKRLVGSQWLLRLLSLSKLNLPLQFLDFKMLILSQRCRIKWCNFKHTAVASNHLWSLKHFIYKTRLIFPWSLILNKSHLLFGLSKAAISRLLKISLEATSNGCTSSSVGVFLVKIVAKALIVISWCWLWVAMDTGVAVKLFLIFLTVYSNVINIVKRSWGIIEAWGTYAGWFDPRPIRNDTSDLLLQFFLFMTEAITTVCVVLFTRFLPWNRWKWSGGCWCSFSCMFLHVK